MPERTTVLFASDHPEDAANLVLQLQSSSQEPLDIIVFSYGPHSDVVVDVVNSMRAYGNHTLCAEAAHPDADEWSALRIPDSNNDVVLMAQDALPMPGWLASLRGGLQPTELSDGSARLFPLLGPIGAVAPVSEQAATVGQRISLTSEDVGNGADAYAQARAATLPGVVSPLEVPDSLALLVTRALIDQLGHAHLLVPGLGRWTLADLLIRAEGAGFRGVVAEGCYMPRVRATSVRPVEPDDADARLRFYREHRGRTTKPQVIAAFRVRLSRYWDLHLLKSAIARVGPMVDGIAILLVNNPLDMQSDPELQAAIKSGALGEAGKTFLVGCSEATSRRVGVELGSWVASITQGSVRIAAEVWDSKPDAVAEANALQGLVARLGTSSNLWALVLEPWELVEEGVTKRVLHKLCAHPNPTVMAYDLSIRALWDSPRLVREDQPWGDGGTYKGGPSHARLYRMLGRPFPRVLEGVGSHAPPHSLDTVRVANLRLNSAKHIRPVDRSGINEEGMRLSALATGARMGLHMLVYERESPEDVARWLDETHGLMDAVALVWTGTWLGSPALDAAESQLYARKDYSSLAFEGGDGPWFKDGPGRVLTEVATLHDARLCHKPLSDNIAEARNAGIDMLALGRLDLALFVDPDEWLSDPIADAQALRAMAESSRLGWLVQVANFTLEGRAPSISDSVRMTRLVPDLRMSGRVHESFADGIAAVQAKGLHPRLSYAPFVLQHRGMALGATRTREKLDHYERMLRMELAERPDNASAWVSLGWHFANDGHPDLAEECLRRSVACAGTAYLPFRELGLVRLREARRLFEDCVERLAPLHPYYKWAQQTLATLQQLAPDADTITKSSAAGNPEPLPDFVLVDVQEEGP